VSRKKKSEQDTGLELGGDFAPSRLRPIDIQQQEFSTSFRGYEPTEVDAFLDRLTEDFAGLHEENKRLKEGGPVVPASGAAAADAEAVLAQARAQADAILAEARTRGAVVGGTTTRTAPSSDDALAAVWPFLAKEREFLRALAASVQEHAEGVKRQVKQIQESANRPSTASAPRPSRSAPSTPPAGSASPASPPAESAVPPSESAWTQTAGDRTPPVVKIPATPVDTPRSPAPPELEGETGDASGDEPTLRELFWNEEG
jgi:cell division initiation protein